MRLIHYITVLFLIVGTSGLSHARSCEPSHSYAIGDKAVYRFTEAGVPSINLSIEVAEENDRETLFSVVENGTSYMVSSPKGGCKPTSGHIQASWLTAPLYTKNHRLYAIINADLSVFGPEFPDSEENRVSIDCATETSIDYDTCLTLYSPVSKNGVVEVQTRRNRWKSNSIASFVSKSQRYPDGRIDSIELVEIEYRVVSFVEMPRSLRGVAYSQTAAEIFWAEPSADKPVGTYEVRRDGVVVAYTNSNNFYDPNRQADEVYVYEVIAVNSNSSRSEPAQIIVNRMGAVAPAISPALPGAQPEVTNLRATAYSGSAGELFWTRIDSDFPVRYEITRNGVTLGEVTGNSYFDNSLQPGVRYNYTITSIGPDNVASQPVSVSMTAQGTIVSGPIGGGIETSFNLDSTVYSSTALELFWPSYTEIPGTRPVRYDIYRDGEFVRPVEGRSYFTDKLSRDTSYEYQVLVFDARNQQIATSEITTVSTRR